VGFCIAATPKTGNNNLPPVGEGANDAPRKQLSFVGHEALLAMTKLADWVNRHGETATTHDLYASFATGKYGNQQAIAERSKLNRLLGCGLMTIFVRH
jgi:hypothetical protein